MTDIEKLVDRIGTCAGVAKKLKVDRSSVMRWLDGGKISPAKLVKIKSLLEKTKRWRDKE